MTEIDVPAAAPDALVEAPSDHRGSWIPTGRMIAARWTELRKRRGLMAVLALVTIGIPTVYLAIRLILHAADPHTYGPAGGFDVYVGMVAGVLYVFGFIVAATLGATAGSIDLSEGMFRHHVITGRSRMALYLARIPAGLGIIVPMIAVGFAIVCAVCVFAAPTSLSFDGVTVPVHLSEPGLEQWADGHAQEVITNFPLRITGGPPPCVPQGRGFKSPTGSTPPHCSPAQVRAFVSQIVRQDYSDYARTFLYPSNSLMVKTGLWIELEALIGFLVALGLASLIGQRTVAVILMIILEIIVTPIAARARLPHMVNLQRSIVGIATAHLEPGGLTKAFGGGGPMDHFLSESTTWAVCVIVAWIVVWTALGAWRMMTRDA